MNINKDKIININYAMILGLYWMIFAASNIFIVPLLRYKGFDNIEIGTLISIRSIAAIVFTPILATFTDKFYHVQIKKIIFVLLIVNIVNTFVMQYGTLNYIQMVVLFIILGMTTNTMPPLHSTMAVRYNYYGKNIKYNIGRGLGSMSYAVMAIILGLLVQNFAVSVILMLQIGLAVISLFVVSVFPKLDKPNELHANKEDEVVHSTFYLIKHYPSFTLFLLASVFTFVGYAMCNSFMIDIIVLKGGDNLDLGIASFILGISELPTALVFIGLKQKFGINRLLNTSAVASLLKMIGLYLAPNIYFLFVVQSLQMLGNGLYWPASVDFVEKIIPAKDQAKGQSLIINFSMNIGGIMGASISGLLLSFTNIENVMLYGVFCSFFGVVFMSFAMGIEKRKNIVLSEVE